MFDTAELHPVDIPPPKWHALSPENPLTLQKPVALRSGHIIINKQGGIICFDSNGRKCRLPPGYEVTDQNGALILSTKKDPEIVGNIEPIRQGQNIEVPPTGEITFELDDNLIEIIYGNETMVIGKKEKGFFLHSWAGDTGEKPQGWNGNTKKFPGNLWNRLFRKRKISVGLSTDNDVCIHSPGYVAQKHFEMTVMSDSSAGRCVVKIKDASVNGLAVSNRGYKDLSAWLDPAVRKNTWGNITQREIRPEQITAVSLGTRTQDLVKYMEAKHGKKIKIEPQENAPLAFTARGEPSREAASVTINALTRRLMDINLYASEPGTNWAKLIHEDVHLHDPLFRDAKVEKQWKRALKNQGFNNHEIAIIINSHVEIQADWELLNVLLYEGMQSTQVYREVYYRYRGHVQVLGDLGIPHPLLRQRINPPETV